MIAGLLGTLTVVGTVGLHLIEDAPWLDCLYMSVITLTTIGFEETIPLSDAGRIFIILYIVCGLGAFTYSAFHLGQWIVSAELRQLLEKRRMEKSIAKLDGHCIVCGQGRMGMTICEYLHERRQPFVVIDIDDDRLASTCHARGWIYLVGDATNDDVLLKAGVQRAKSLTSVLATDSDNLYVVLSARMLNNDLQIICRASDEKAIEKMERAGATRVVSPFRTGAVKMARFMLNPSIEDFLEIADSQGNDLELADVQIAEHSPYVGRKLMETDLRDKGVMVIGIRRLSGERLMPPPGDARIEAGDSLFAFGSAESVNAMIGEADRTE